MKKNIIKITIFTLLLFVTFFAFTNKAYMNIEFENLVIGGQTITDRDTGNPVLVPKNYEEKNKEFRGVWIATVWNLDMPLHTSEAQYKNAYKQKLDIAEEYGFNSILFQTRGMNDTFYESDYAPFSKVITGVEGGNPGWDILEWMISETHSRGMEFHAWMNPYRVVSSGVPNYSGMHEKNFAKQRQDLVIKSGDAHILNPGEPEVRDYIRNVVTEIMEKYPSIDGIHFDDYFYFGGSAEDSATYQKYGNGLTLENFRRESINKLIEGLSDDITNFNLNNDSRVKFGISPSGIYLNKSSSTPNGSNTSGQQHYYSHFIDTVKWINEGWLDYITPQVYWEFNHQAAPYAEVVKWWVDVVKGSGVDLIIGHSVSDAGWNQLERAKQILFNSQFPEIKGSIMYSHKNINSTGRLEYVKDNYWLNKVPTIYANNQQNLPEISITGEKDGNTYISDVIVEFNSNLNVLYKVGIEGQWTQYTEPIILDHHGRKDLYYQAIDTLGNTSDIGIESIVIRKENNKLPTINISGTKDNEDYISDVIVNINADSSVEIEYYIMSGIGSVAEFVKYEGEFTVSSPGKHIIYARTTLGNTPSQVITKEFTIKEPLYDVPEINITGIGTFPNYKEATVTIETLNPNGAQVKVNGGRWQTYLLPLQFNEVGTYVIETRNITASRDIVTKTFYIEEEQLEFSDVEIIFNGNIDNGIYNTEVVVSFENIHSSEKLYYRINHNLSWSSYILYSGPFTINKNGLHYFQYYLKNSLGENSEVKEDYITIDIPLDPNSATVIRDGKEVLKEDGSSITLPTNYNEKDNEVRAVWFSTVSNIDLPKKTGSIEQYKELIRYKFDVMKKNKINTVFFQVRPMNDALYYSSYAPYSRYITGTEGNDPGFDILEFAIELAHERGIELHAWLNPYRVSNASGSKQTILSLLHDENFAKKNPNLVLEDSQGKLILNPGEPQVQTYLNNIILELVTKYNIDGIHFDDYFYSYSGTPSANDQVTYNKYKLPNESLADWRRRSVNIAVENTSITVRNTNKNIKFGISPFGIWRNKSTDPNGSYTNGLQSYDSQYADSKKWVEEGWLDYIAPQLYWHFDNFSSSGNPIAPFADLVDWWYDLTSTNNVGLIIGQALYRLSPTESAKFSYQYEIIEQMRYISKFNGILGSSFFTYNNLEEKTTNITFTLDYINNNLWTKTVDFPWESNVDAFVTPPITEKYTVSFDINYEGGINPDPQIITLNSFATRPLVTRKGFLLTGWYLDGELFDFNNAIDKDITLVANWEKSDTYTVTFDVNYEDNSSNPSTQEVNFDEKVTIPKDPTRKGYKFLGWYLDNQLFDFDIPANENITLIAKWEKQANNKIIIIASVSSVLVIGSIGMILLRKRKI